MWALRTVGVRRVFGPCAVGSLTADLRPGALVVPDQLVDRTSGRPATYFDSGAVHVGFADPYFHRAPGRLRLPRSVIRTAATPTASGIHRDARGRILHLGPKRSHCMTGTNLSENTVTVGGKQIFYAETGTGPAVLLLHGGGPGASGVSNYSRNIDALAEGFRVIVPDLPGYGRSTKGVDGCDPFGYLANGIRGLMNQLDVDTAHLVGNSYGGPCALRLALDTPDRVDRDGVDGTRRHRHHPRAPDRRPSGACSAYYSGDGPSRDKLETFIRILVYDGDCGARLSSSTSATSPASTPRWSPNPPLRRPSGLMALRTLWRMDFTRDRRLAYLRTPTLVVWGAADKVNRPSGGQTLADTHAQLRPATSRPTPGTGCSGNAPTCSTTSPAFLAVSCAMNSVFGKVRLGYVVIETEKFADWRRFGEDAIGMHCDELSAEHMRFRLDDHECRFLLRRGPEEDVTAIGWHLDDHDTFDEIIRRVD